MALHPGIGEGENGRGGRRIRPPLLKIPEGKQKIPHFVVVVKEEK
jgi:hypothetical protein